MEKLENHMFAQMCLFAPRESSRLVFDFQYIAADAVVFVGFDNNGCN